MNLKSLLSPCCDSRVKKDAGIAKFAFSFAKKASIRTDIPVGVLFSRNLILIFLPVLTQILSALTWKETQSWNMDLII